jgi:hypothetical protein
MLERSHITHKTTQPKGRHTTPAPESKTHTQIQNLSRLIRINSDPEPEHILRSAHIISTVSAAYTEFDYCVWPPTLWFDRMLSPNTVFFVSCFKAKNLRNTWPEELSLRRTCLFKLWFLTCWFDQPVLAGWSARAVCRKLVVRFLCVRMFVSA